MKKTIPSEDAGRVRVMSGAILQQPNLIGDIDARGARLPFPVPEIVLVAQEQLDWDSFLPERAHGVRWKLEQTMKRVIDITGALIGIVLLLPLFVALAAIVYLDSPGPIFYRWKVLGRHARPFVGYKFRTMVVNADDLKATLLAKNEMKGPVFKIRDDPRITRVGRWLRKSSLDELPQLWSVLLGHMSLVGPRPPSPAEFAQFEPWQRKKLAVIPGITCLWQVSGRSNIVDFNEWVALDLKYISEWSVLLDLKLLLRTIFVVLRGHGAC